jgi:hypothetical protein
MQILSLEIPHRQLRIFVCKSGDFYLAKNTFLHYLVDNEILPLEIIYRRIRVKLPEVLPELSPLKI